MKLSYIQASILSSTLEVCYSHPIDVIKTYKQNSTPLQFNKDLFKVFKKSIGIRILGIVPSRTNFWLGQEFAKQYTNNIISIASFSSLCQTIVETPVENVKYSRIYNLPKINIWRGFMPHYLRNNLYLCSFLSISDNDNKIKSGLTAGAIGAVITHPIDYIKTRIQCNHILSFKDILHNWHHGLGYRTFCCSTSLAFGNYTYHAFLDFLEPNYSTDIQ